ncbi:hypothetical protein I7I48_00898 [Histoplasma ohiense]|nr:hypothetical protein I7I48_00898 [Histoplasma ohiense (nom. inval.)]
MLLPIKCEQNETKKRNHTTSLLLQIPFKLFLCPLPQLLCKSFIPGQLRVWNGRSHRMVNATRLQETRIILTCLCYLCRRRSPESIVRPLLQTDVKEIPHSHLHHKPVDAIHMVHQLCRHNHSRVNRSDSKFRITSSQLGAVKDVGQFALRVQRVFRQHGWSAHPSLRFLQALEVNPGLLWRLPKGKRGSNNDTAMP